MTHRIIWRGIERELRPGPVAGEADPRPAPPLRRTWIAVAFVGLAALIEKLLP